MKRVLTFLALALLILLVLYCYFEVKRLQATARNMQCCGKMSQLSCAMSWYCKDFILKDEKPTFWRVKCLDCFELSDEQREVLLTPGPEGLVKPRVGNNPFHSPDGEVEGSCNYVAVLTEDGYFYTHLTVPTDPNEILVVLCDRYSDVKLYQDRDIKLLDARRIVEREKNFEAGCFSTLRAKNQGIFWNGKEQRFVRRTYTENDLERLECLSRRE